MSQEINDQEQSQAQTVSDVEEVLGTSDFSTVLNDQIEKSQVPKTEETAESPKEEVSEKSTEVKDENEPEKSEATEESVPETDEPVELSEEQKAWKLAFDNRESWNKAYKERDMTESFLAKMDDVKLAQFLPKIMPFVHGHEKLPDNYDDVVTEVLGNIDIPETLMYKDTDFDEDIAIPKSVYEPILSKAVKEAITKTLPELPILRKSHAETQKKLKAASDYVQTMEKQNGEVILNYFAKEYPESIPSTVNDTETASQAVLRVLDAGDVHPEYVKVLRIQQAGNYRLEVAEKGKTISFTDAYDKLFGLKERQKAQEDKVKSNVAERQAKTQAEKTGRTVTPDKNAKLYDYLGTSHTQAVEDILAKELGN